MGRTTTMKATKSHTLPSSPTHSSSSSDFEFTISLSPVKSTVSSVGGGNSVSTTGCPADDLFYKGQLLPLHLSPRLSMVRTLLLSSSSTSSSSTATTSRPSSGSSTDCDSSRPSSAAEDDRNHSSAGGDALTARLRPHYSSFSSTIAAPKKTNKYFSLSRFSSVFKPRSRDPSPGPGSSSGTGSGSGSGSSVKRISTTARDVICKYLKKVKPLYEKLSQKQQSNQKTETVTAPLNFPLRDGSVSTEIKKERISVLSGGSFSGNLRYPRRRSCVSSCPSSMRSSPSHSGILSRNGGTSTPNGMLASSSSSSMEELQSAIQGAIAHCKNSMSKSNIEI